MRYLILVIHLFYQNYIFSNVEKINKQKKKSLELFFGVFTGFRAERVFSSKNSPWEPVFRPLKI